MTVFRRGFLTFTAAAMAAAATFGTASTSAAEEVTLRLHQFLPAPATVPKDVLIPWIEKVQAASDGRITIQHFPSMQLGGKPPELIDQAKDGVADIVWTLPGYTPGRFPRTEVFELPFMMTNAEAMSRANWTMAEKHMMDTDFKDLKILATWVHGPGLIHSADPIASPEDLDGVKLRAPTRITNKMFASLGATAVGMPIPAVPEALSKGVIDATVIPWEVTAPLKTSELVEYHLEFEDASLYTSTFVLAMNKDSYEALPDDLKAVIDENSGLELSAMAGRATQAGDVPGRAIAEDLGNEITTLSPAEVDAWKAAAAPVVDAWIAEVSEQGIDGAALVEEARALIAEFTQ